MWTLTIKPHLFDATISPTEWKASASQDTTTLLAFAGTHDAARQSVILMTIRHDAEAAAIINLTTTEQLDSRKIDAVKAAVEAEEAAKYAAETAAIQVQLDGLIAKLAVLEPEKEYRRESIEARIVELTALIAGRKV